MRPPNTHTLTAHASTPKTQTKPAVWYCLLRQHTTEGQVSQHPKHMHYKALAPQHRTAMHIVLPARAAAMEGTKRTAGYGTRSSSDAPLVTHMLSNAVVNPGRSCCMVVSRSDITRQRVRHCTPPKYKHCTVLTPQHKS
jgi:hypothetical protein